VIEEPVAPLLHVNVAPVAPDAVSVEEPQVLSTVIVGLAGTARGAAVALLLGALSQPFTV